ncbi:metallophosphoesterase family protein [Desulfonatronum thioautotrophicum]|uniref:metallophosphoesterase family protein n=1 Tax=Desulfonatronum thioautotrophicum TaxID=617001 RepID=UPI0005EB9611|nr:metallophosphoesterase family protein [Desulfonatronum thioautotrophicum]
MSPLVGVISDTHGLMRSSALDALKKCDLILHAGDVCGQEIIEALQGIQRTVFVRGNMDRPTSDSPMPKTEAVDFSGKRFFVIHDLYELDLDPKAAGVDVVIHGHTHTPDIAYRDDVLYLNPGSIGPKRFTLPVSMALIRINGDTLHPELVTLPD